MRILFIGGGKRVSMVKRFKKAAKSLNLDFSIISYDLVPEVHVAPYVDKVIVGEPFSSWSIARLQQIEADIIVPFMDDALPLLANYRDKFPLAVVSSSKIVEICNDKFLTEITFCEWGMKIPKFDGTFPAIAKYRYGYGSRDQMMINDKADLWNVNRERYVIQKFIKGTEYTVDCYVDKEGEIKGIVPRKRLLVTRGEVENSVTIDHPILIEQCESILKHGGFFGPITFQFIQGEDELYFIEANARFGGGVIVSIEAGANYPKMILQEWLGQKFGRATYKPNLLMIRSSRETFFENYG